MSDLSQGYGSTVPLFYKAIDNAPKDFNIPHCHVDSHFMRSYPVSDSAPNREMVQYTVQLGDEVNQRSTLLKDMVRRPDPAYALSRRKDPRPLQNSGGTVVVDAKSPMNTAIDAATSLISKIGVEPEIKDVKINYWTESRISVAIKASDNKGVDKVVFDTRNSLGEIANQNSVNCDVQ